MIWLCVYDTVIFVRSNGKITGTSVLFC